MTKLFADGGKMVVQKKPAPEHSPLGTIIDAAGGVVCSFGEAAR